MIEDTPKGRAFRRSFQRALEEQQRAAGAPLPSITCPKCNATSYHPRDIAEGYCGICHDWTSRPVRAEIASRN